MEKRIRSIINLLKDAKRIKRNPALAGELGFNFSTETDIANARAQLEILLDAYQHPKQGEMEDVKRKAAAWDGKSPVNPTLSELIGEAKLLVPYSTAEASPAEDTKIMDDLFSSMALDAKELTFENREYSNAECIKALASDSETPFVNDETGIEARINRKQRDKITSGAAQRKSEASGFSSGVHNYVASNIRKLFKHATLIGEYADKNRRENIISIKRFACPIMVGNRGAFAYMTVKESKGKGNRIYTIELDEIKKLEGNLDEHLNEMYNPSSSSVIVSRLRELGKSYFGNSFENSSDDISSSAISTSNPDDIAAQYANARKGSLAHRMMTHARAEANRFRRVLRKPTTDAEAAQDLASVLIFMESAMRYVPSVHLPRMTAKRNALEAYIKMMQNGRIGVNRNGTIRRSGLTQEQIDAVAEQAAAAYEEAVARQDILPENKLTKEESKKLQRDFIRAAARDNIGATISSIYDDIASSIATALSDKLIDRMHTRIGQLQPKVSANRKPLEAKVRPDAFREVGEISRVMQLSQADFEKEQEALYAEMDNEDNTTERASELDRKFALLRTYGALRSRTYAEVQAAYTDLMAYIATERHLWQDILEQRNQQINEDLQNFYNKVSPEKGDAYNRQRGREKLETLFGRLGGYWRELQSPSQLFLALSGHEALKGIAKRTMDGIANANAAILGAEHRRETAMLSAYARIFGIKPLGRDGQYTEKQLHKLRNGSFADFTQDILKIRNTGITRRYTDDATGNEVAVEIEASDSQLMNLILTAEQDDYKGNAEKWGYTDDILAAVKNHLGSRKLAFAYALRTVLQSDNLPKIFEERKGLLMPENPNYWPGHLDLTRLSQQESAALINNYSKGGTYGMLRNRVANNYDFALADVLSVFRPHAPSATTSSTWSPSQPHGGACSRTHPSPQGWKDSSEPPTTALYPASWTP